MSTSLMPLEGFDQLGPHHQGGPPPFALLLGVPVFLLFLLIAASAFFLSRRHGFGPPPFVREASPETDAKRVLAERFAKGDISSDDFLERASVLNWTPGSENWQSQQRRRRR